MFNLSRYVTLSNVVRNFGVTKKLFASTSVIAEKIDPVELRKPQEQINRPKNPKIAAIFATLNDLQDNELENRAHVKGNLDEIIGKAQTVNGLLAIAETQAEISRKDALKIVSILAEWSSINRIKLNEFENDTRFTKLCRVLGRAVNTKNAISNVNRVAKKISDFRTEDLNMVLGVTGDDEAAKLVARITLEQMVKVMKNLALKKRRSTPLLRSLAFNMSSKDQKLDIKQCADVLYAMASLNFPDHVLISKICDDLQEEIKEPIEKSNFIGNILSSLSFLKYRDPILIDNLVEWIVKHQEICRSHDIAAVFLSLATLNYMPVDYEEALRTKLATSLNHVDFKTSQDYLAFVWSLMVLNCPFEESFSSVLTQEFVDQIISENEKELPITAKMKLLNINAGVKLLLPTYKGAMLMKDTNKDIYDVPLIHNREKQTTVNGMIDALKSLVPDNCLKLNVDTNMGFVVDAEFYVDDKGNPVAKEVKNGKRVALMIHDFRDTVSQSQGSHQEVNGSTALNLRLLTKAGYHVIGVPYYEFSISDKLLKRVQYLEKIIKALNSN